ncbi:Leu/Ile/Val-binding protein [Fundidesulfovibrio magnetotacticus]|uniref:Leu/Ile/Val-binding protein n=1 Tax=Fundidesulfovibrio magnetotacticus TaxID=2730080 RepID=A0A6V8LPF6_9BACT|nr:ABC transporter substrate-binding protein [Fundidesulfovibrio magnetotacticus]GFK92880.1 Leu/Ile/Val-binding protein [Fundidesulfovibrio magnetotacticus]
MEKGENSLPRRSARTGEEDAVRAVLSMILAAALWAAPALAAKPVVVGVLYNLTGSQASLDVPGLEGARLAAEAVNSKGGVKGRPLVLEVRDCGTDVERCREAARELAALGVAAVVGLNDSDFALAAGEAVTLAKVPFVTAGATLPTLPRTLGPYFFMACFGDDAQAKALAKFAVRRKGITSMMLTANRDFAFTTVLAGSFVKSFKLLGGDIPAQARYGAAPGGVLGSPVPACLADGACQGAFVAGMPEDAPRTVKALREAGFKGPVFSGDGFDTPLLEQVGEMAKPGVFFSTHVSYDSPRAEVRRFVEAWTRAHGSRPVSGFAALGHDAVALVADALARAGSDEPAQLRRALAQTRAFVGVTGRIGFEEPQEPPLKVVAIERYDGVARVFEAEVQP